MGWPYTRSNLVLVLIFYNFSATLLFVLPPNKIIIHLDINEYHTFVPSNCVYFFIGRSYIYNFFVFITICACG